MLRNTFGHFTKRRIIRLSWEWSHSIGNEFLILRLAPQVQVNSIQDLIAINRFQAYFEAFLIFTLFWKLIITHHLIIQLSRCWSHSTGNWILHHMALWNPQSHWRTSSTSLAKFKFSDFWPLFTAFHVGFLHVTNVWTILANQIFIPSQRGSI